MKALYFCWLTVKILFFVVGMMLIIEGIMDQYRISPMYTTGYQIFYIVLGVLFSFRQTLGWYEDFTYTKLHEYMSTKIRTTWSIIFVVLDAFYWVLLLFFLYYTIAFNSVEIISGEYWWLFISFIILLIASGLSSSYVKFLFTLSLMYSWQYNSFEVFKTLFFAPVVLNEILISTLNALIAFYNDNNAILVFFILLLPIYIVSHSLSKTVFERSTYSSGIQTIHTTTIIDVVFRNWIFGALIIIVAIGMYLNFTIFILQHGGSIIFPAMILLPLFELLHTSMTELNTVPTLSDVILKKLEFKSKKVLV